MEMTDEQTEIVERVRANSARAARRPNGSPPKPRARKTDTRYRIGPDGKRHLVIVRDGVEGYLFDPMGKRQWVPFEVAR